MIVWMSFFSFDPIAMANLFLVPIRLLITGIVLSSTFSNITALLPSSLLTIAGNSNVVLTFFLILMISSSFSSNSKNFLRSFYEYWSC